MKKAEADLAMEAKEEDEAQTEEKAPTLLESLRSLLGEGKYPQFIKKMICHVHAKKLVIHSSNGSLFVRTHKIWGN